MPCLLYHGSKQERETLRATRLGLVGSEWQMAAVRGEVVPGNYTPLVFVFCMYGSWWR
jgi:hypothetical protein